MKTKRLLEVLAKNRYPALDWVRGQIGEKDEIDTIARDHLKWDRHNAKVPKAGELVRIINQLEAEREDV